jgi:hypothetical protein
LTFYLKGRDPEFCDLNINFTSDVFHNALTINLFPKFLHPIVGRIFTSRKTSLKKAVRLMQPMIEERLKLREKYENDWPDKPVRQAVLTNNHADYSNL